MAENRKYLIFGIIILLLAIYFYILGGWQGVLISLSIILVVTLIIMGIELSKCFAIIWSRAKELGFERKKKTGYYVMEKTHKEYTIQITEPGVLIDENYKDYVSNTVDLFFRRNIFRNNIVIRRSLPLEKGVAIIRKEKNIHSHNTIKITGLEKNNLSCRSEDEIAAKKFLKPAVVNKIVSFEKEHDISKMLKSSVGVPILFFNKKGMFFTHLHYSTKKKALENIIKHLIDIMEAVK